MKRRWLFLCFAFIIIIGSSITFFLLKSKFHPRHHLCFKGPYFGAVPITLSCDNIPCVEIEVEGKKISAQVDLGSSCVVALPRSFLKELNQKSLLGQVSYYGMRGKKYHSDLYEIPKVKIGEVAMRYARVEELNSECIKDSCFSERKQGSSDKELARIGWKWFFNSNVFLDCESHIMAFCDSLDTLKKQGYPVDLFAETSFLLDRNLIEIEVKTHKGKMRCVLDTGCTLNFLNRDLEDESNSHMIFNLDNIDQYEVLNPDNRDQSVLDLKNHYEMPVFKIGKKDFGKTNFTKLKTPLEVDAFIGMEFLRSKLVFIDFPNRKIYFCEKTTK